jgi:ribosome-binding factor A
MSQRRVQKVAEAIREVVGMAILADIKDPRVRDVTVTYVEVSADLRYAKIHVSVMGDEGHQRLSLRGLQSAAGYLQAKVAERLALRYTPRISFLLDQGVKRSIEVARILKEVLPPEPQTAGESDQSDDVVAVAGDVADQDDAEQTDVGPPPPAEDRTPPSPPSASGPGHDPHPEPPRG